jgi:hypothetical protein
MLAADKAMRFGGESSDGSSAQLVEPAAKT